MKIGLLFLLFISSAKELAQEKSDSISTKADSASTKTDSLSTMNDSLSTDSLSMERMIYDLPEVMIKGERPIAVVHGSAITYDLPRLIEKKGVDNVYDAIKELPGVTESGSSYQLAGRKVNIAINGKVMTLNEEQLAQLLKSMPASRLKKADVMYSAPAKTQVRGALINLELKKETTGGQPLEGEVNLAYNQEHYAMFDERASVLYHKDKFSLDAFYLHSHGKKYGIRDEESHHSLKDGTMHDITMHQSNKTKRFGHDYRLGAEYDFADNHSLSFSYQGSYGNSDTDYKFAGNIIGNTLLHSKTWLHNARLDYQTPFGLSAGIETTYYHNPETQDLNSKLPSGDVNFSVDNNQKVNVWRYYLSMENQLKNNWSINYGAWYKQSLNHSMQKYISGAEGYSYIRQKEDIANIYVGVGKNWKNKLILDASIAAEYYHSVVWEKWNVYPTLNLTYVHQPGNIWVLGFSNKRIYPDYWEMNNITVYANGGYDEITGNPYIKPINCYHTQLVWILKNKYQFAAWFNYNDNYFIQVPYQHPERLNLVFKSINFNYQQQAGVQVVVPHKFGNWLDAKLTLTGVWLHEKCEDFYEIPFNRAIFLGIAKMSNVITLSEAHNLSFTVDGMIHSNSLQGIYDLPAAGKLDLGLRWQFWKKQATLHAFCKDIFETSAINPHIDYKGQKLDMDFACFRQLGISLTIKFGGYKEKKHKEVDTSRFRN